MEAPEFLEQVHQETLREGGRGETRAVHYSSLLVEGKSQPFLLFAQGN